MDYEKQFAELEQILARLEMGQQPLEEALKDYEHGFQLAQDCARMLQEASGRIEKLGKGERVALDEDGNETEK